MSCKVVFIGLNSNTALNKQQISGFFMDELNKIKISYAKGELSPILKQLENFISCNKEQILKFKIQEEKNWDRPLDLSTATKLFILHVRSIDSRAEMLDQISQINKDFENCFQDTQKQNIYCIDWVKKYAPIWRAFRVLAIIYVFDQNRDMLLSNFDSEMSLLSNWKS